MSCCIDSFAILYINRKLGEMKQDAKNKENYEKLSFSFHKYEMHFVCWTHCSLQLLALIFLTCNI